MSDKPIKIWGMKMWFFDEKWIKNFPILFFFSLFFVIINGCAYGKESYKMQVHEYIVKAKVLNVFDVEDYVGDCNVAGHEVNFIIALLIEDTKKNYVPVPEDQKLSFTTYEVAFFGVHSVTALIGPREELIGSSYYFSIRLLDFGDSATYGLSFEGFVENVSDIERKDDYGGESDRHY